MSDYKHYLLEIKKIIQRPNFPPDNMINGMSRDQIETYVKISLATKLSQIESILRGVGDIAE